MNKLQEVQSRFNEFMQEFTDVQNYILLLKTADETAIVVKGGSVQESVNIIAQGIQLILNNASYVQKDMPLEPTEVEIPVAVA